MWPYYDRAAATLLRLIVVSVVTMRLSCTGDCGAMLLSQARSIHVSISTRASHRRCDSRASDASGPPTRPTRHHSYMADNAWWHLSVTPSRLLTRSTGTTPVLESRCRTLRSRLVRAKRGLGMPHRRQTPVVHRIAHSSVRSSSLAASTPEHDRYRQGSAPLAAQHVIQPTTQDQVSSRMTGSVIPMP